MKNFSLLFILSSALICGCITTAKKVKYDDLPVKTVTVTINKTTTQDLISAWGQPSGRRSHVFEKNMEEELCYNYIRSGGNMLVANVCNERNQCANNGKKTHICFKFRDNKFVHIWENLHPE